MDELTPLSAAGLSALPRAVQRPRYRRETLRPGILHIGVGNFHRAHQAWYLHRLLQEGRDRDWAIIGAGVRPGDAAMRGKLLAQDCLTTLIKLDPTGSSAEVTGPMIDFLPVEPDNASLIRQMADPAIRIVSLTVTEGGYYRNPATRRFDDEHPDIRHDAEHPIRPRTAFGAMVAALRLRRAAGSGPFTGLSCDNLEANGHVLRETVVGLARLSDPALADWIEGHCSFPNAMVDCIVPATGEREVALARALGINDRAPVTHEPFRQWVIEDDFCAGRPAWDQVGVIFTDRVHDYEVMKIRVLNAGHQVAAVPGELLSMATIASCMEEPLIRDFFRRVLREEIAPQVPPVPEMATLHYVDLIEKRFSNTSILDTTRRVAFDGSSRQTGFVLPTLRDALAAGTPIEGIALLQALWARMCAGTREDGSAIAPNDPHWEALGVAAQEARQRPMAWLEQRRLYGDLADEPRFAEAFGKWLTLIWREGCGAALMAYVRG
ncbi:MAG: mannitol dehydrogenase family protein [Pseudomonadota bacterium]